MPLKGKHSLSLLPASEDHTEKNLSLFTTEALVAQALRRNLIGTTICSSLVSRGKPSLIVSAT
jgi:hypothetical protein